MSSNRKQISYTPLMELEILKAVKAAGAHIAEHGKVTDKWNIVNDLVFNSDLFQQYKQEYVLPGWEKVRC